MSANRMKVILPKIISLNQSAFTPRCFITDNILVAYDTFHYMNSLCSDKKVCVEVKLDMSKAYDRVQWILL